MWPICEQPTSPNSEAGAVHAHHLFTPTLCRAAHLGEDFLVELICECCIAAELVSHLATVHLLSTFGQPGSQDEVLAFAFHSNTFPLARIEL